MQGDLANNEAPPPPSWNDLFQRALITAQFLVSRLRWRGDYGGVLPHGYDPNSIAAETILDLIKAQPPGALGPPSLSAAQLRRLVWRHVDRLHHRKENFFTVSEPDLAAAFDEDGCPDSPINLIPAPDLTPLEFLLQKEDDARFRHFQARFKKRLGRHHRLKRLFDLLCEGISKPAHLARTLKVRLRAIDNLKKRLRRLLIRFPSPNLRIILFPKKNFRIVYY